MKFIKWIVFIVLILLTICIVIVHIFESEVNGSNKSTISFFKKADVPYERIVVDSNNREVSAILTGAKDSKKLICFLHGAPGAWNAYKDYLVDSVLLESYQIISVDRLGYGQSSYGQSELDLLVHTDALEDILEQVDYDSLVVVSHSYGGPISGVYASRNDKKLVATIMLSPVNAPDAERIFWFNQILNYSVIKSILPNYINVATDEKLGHAQSLKEIENIWSQIRTPITHMHCTDDWLAPAKENIAFSENYISSDYLDLEVWSGASHFIPFNSKQKVVDKILSYF